MKRLFIAIIVFDLVSVLANATPMELLTGPFDSGKVSIGCEFDGNHQICRIDTGSPRSFIKKDEFSLAYPSKGTIETGGASGTILKCDLINITHAAIYPEFLNNNLDLARCPLGSEEGPQESVVGLDFFSNRVVHFDFLHRDLSQKLAIPSHLVQHPIQVEPRGHLSIPVRIGSSISYGVWDTGAGLTSIDEKFVQQAPENFEYVRDIWGNDGIGSPILMKLYTANELIIGDKTFNNVFVIAFDFSPIRRQSVRM